MADDEPDRAATLIPDLSPVPVIDPRTHRADWRHVFQSLGLGEKLRQYEGRSADARTR